MTTESKNKTKSVAILAGLEGHPEGMKKYSSMRYHNHSRKAETAFRIDRHINNNKYDQLYINGELRSFHIDELSNESGSMFQSHDFSRNGKVPLLTLKKPRSNEPLASRPLQDVAGRVSQSFTFGEGGPASEGGRSTAFTYEPVNFSTPHDRTSLETNWRRSSFTFGPGGNKLSQPMATASPRCSTDSRTNSYTNQQSLGMTHEYLSIQDAEEYVANIDGSTPRKLSTRDKYIEEDHSNIWNMDPADHLKEQLKSMLVSNPEIEKRIQDVIKDNVDLATTTTQLDIQKDKTGAYCINQYIKIRALGQGAYGKVKLCYNTVDKQLYAVKMIDRKRLKKQFRTGRSLRKSKDRRNHSDRAGSEFLREIAVLKKLEHHNVVKLHEVINPSDESQPLMLVMEYLEGGPVVEQLKAKPGIQFETLSEELALEYFRMMCKGLDYLHYNRIVHGDLKPENLLLHGKGELKIADFGCARIMAVDSNLDRNNRYGTPSFRAPEMLTANGYDPFNADIWAMGVCLYVMVYGVLPFQGNSETDIYQAIQTQELQFPENEDVSKELQNLLGLILEKDPLKRITLYDIMCHEWVTEWGKMQLIPLMQMTQPPNPIQVSLDEEDLAIVENNNMISTDFEEKVFSDGELLMECGDTSNVLYFILSGAVEVKDPQTCRASEDLRFSLTLERDVDDMMFDSCIVEEEEEEEEGSIHLDIQRTAEVTSRVKQNALRMHGNEFIREVKGPANIIGDLSICYPVRPFPYNVQAKGEVHALELTSDKLQSALMSVYDQHAKKVLQVFTGNELQGPSTPSITPRRGRRNATTRSNNTSFNSVTSALVPLRSKSNSPR